MYEWFSMNSMTDVKGSHKLFDCCLFLGIIFRRYEIMEDTVLFRGNFSDISFREDKTHIVHSHSLWKLSSTPQVLDAPRHTAGGEFNTAISSLNLKCMCYNTSFKTNIHMRISYVRGLIIETFWGACITLNINLISGNFLIAKHCENSKARFSIYSSVIMGVCMYIWTDES